MKFLPCYLKENIKVVIIYSILVLLMIYPYLLKEEYKETILTVEHVVLVFLLIFLIFRTRWLKKKV